MAELSIRDKKQIKKHVTNCCANYSKEYGCLPLESECYMFSIGFNDSKLCKYYEQAVLPTAAELFALFKGIPTKKCQQCGKLFASVGRKAYCSEKCATEARRHQTAERVRKHRANKSEM